MFFVFWRPKYLSLSILHIYITFSWYSSFLYFLIQKNTSGDICNYCVAKDVDGGEDGSGCDNETFMVICLGAMLKQCKKKQTKDFLPKNFFQPVVVNLPSSKNRKRKKYITTTSATSATVVNVQTHKNQKINKGREEEEEEEEEEDGKERKRIKRVQED